MSPGPSSSASLLEIRREAEGFCVASRGCLVVVVWGRDVVAQDLELLSEVQREVVASVGHNVVLSIIRAGLSMSVNEGVREGGQANLREFQDATLASVMVVEAGGMRAAFFRSVVTGIHLVTRTKVEQRVFDSIDEGVRWLLARPGVDPQTVAERDALIAEAFRVADLYGTN